MCAVRLKSECRPAVFLDRDGVIIENRGDYVRSWDDVEFLPGALDAVSRLKETEHVVVIVTNQSAVGRGIISFEEALAINRRVIREIELHGGSVDACYMCPHQPDDACTCRKPSPGMLRQATQELDIDLTRSFLVGDSVSDMEAAEAAGAQGILVLTGRGHEQASLLPERLRANCAVVSDLLSSIDQISHVPEQ